MPPTWMGENPSTFCMCRVRKKEEPVNPPKAAS
jgi:hypothetical protein